MKRNKANLNQDHIDEYISDLKKKNFRIKKKHRFKIIIKRTREATAPLDKELDEILTPHTGTPLYDAKFLNSGGSQATLFFDSAQNWEKCFSRLRSQLHSANTLEKLAYKTKLLVRNLPLGEVNFPQDGPIVKLLHRFRNSAGDATHVGIVLVENFYLDDLLLKGYSLQGKWLTFEKLRDSELWIIICSRCGDYGHFAHQCKNDPVCKYCSGAHLSSDCDLKEDTENYKCKHCGEGHTYLYWNCPLRKKVIATFGPDAPSVQKKTSIEMLGRLTATTHDIDERIACLYSSFPTPNVIDDIMEGWESRMRELYEKLARTIESSFRNLVNHIDKLITAKLDAQEAFWRSREMTPGRRYY